MASSSVLTIYSSFDFITSFGSLSIMRRTACRVRAEEAEDQALQSHILRRLFKMQKRNQPDFFSNDRLGRFDWESDEETDDGREVGDMRVIAGYSALFALAADMGYRTSVLKIKLRLTSRVVWSDDRRSRRLP